MGKRRKKKEKKGNLFSFVRGEKEGGGGDLPL